MGDYEKGEKDGKKMAEYEKKHPFVAPLTSDFIAAVERGCQSEEFKRGYDSGRGVSFGDMGPNESSSGEGGGGAGEGSAYDGGGSYSPSSSIGFVGYLVVLGVIVVLAAVSYQLAQALQSTGEVEQETRVRQERWEQFVSNSDRWLETPTSALSLPGKIVFISSREGSRRIFLVDPNSDEEPVDLTGQLAGDMGIVVPSLDGRKIAFDTWQWGEHFARDIYVMDSDGTDLTPMVDSLVIERSGRFSPWGLSWPVQFWPDGLDSPVSVSPQGWSLYGNKVVFHYGHPNDRIGMAELRDPGSLRSLSPIQWLDITGQNPAWSPDGKWIAFDNNGTIYALEIATGNVRKIVGPTFSGRSGEKPFWVFASW